MKTMDTVGHANLTIHHKRELLSNLINSIRDELFDKIPNAPDNWDGFELRAWLMDKVQHECGDMQKRMGRARAKSFRQELHSSNL